MSELLSAELSGTINNFLLHIGVDIPYHLKLRDRLRQNASAAVGIPAASPVPAFLNPPPPPKTISPPLINTPALSLSQSTAAPVGQTLQRFPTSFTPGSGHAEHSSPFSVVAEQQQQAMLQKHHYAAQQQQQQQQQIQQQAQQQQQQQAQHHQQQQQQSQKAEQQIPLQNQHFLFKQQEMSQQPQEMFHQFHMQSFSFQQQLQRPLAGQQQTELQLQSNPIFLTQPGGSPGSSLTFQSASISPPGLSSTGMLTPGSVYQHGVASGQSFPANAATEPLLFSNSVQSNAAFSLPGASPPATVVGAPAVFQNTAASARVSQAAEHLKKPHVRPDEAGDEWSELAGLLISPGDLGSGAFEGSSRSAVSDPSSPVSPAPATTSFSTWAPGNKSVLGQNLW